MTKGKARVAQASGGYGYFAEVELEVELGGQGLRLDFGPGATEWQEGARFGVAYALEHKGQSREDRRGARVRVLQIRGHAIDTTSMVVAYAAMLALWDALGESPARAPRIEGATGIFSIPG